MARGGGGGGETTVGESGASEDNHKRWCSHGSKEVYCKCSSGSNMMKRSMEK